MSQGGVQLQTPRTFELHSDCICGCIEGDILKISIQGRNHRVGCMGEVLSKSTVYVNSWTTLAYRTLARRSTARVSGFRPVTVRTSECGHFSTGIRTVSSKGVALTFTSRSSAPPLHVHTAWREFQNRGRACIIVKSRLDPEDAGGAAHYLSPGSSGSWLLSRRHFDSRFQRNHEDKSLLRKCATLRRETHKGYSVELRRPTCLTCPTTIHTGTLELDVLPYA